MSTCHEFSFWVVPLLSGCFVRGVVCCSMRLSVVLGVLVFAALLPMLPLLGAVYCVVVCCCCRRRRRRTGRRSFFRSFDFFFSSLLSEKTTGTNASSRKIKNKQTRCVRENKNKSHAPRAIQQQCCCMPILSYPTAAPKADFA